MKPQIRMKESVAPQEPKQEFLPDEAERIAYDFCAAFGFSGFLDDSIPMDTLTMKVAQLIRETRANLKESEPKQPSEQEEVRRLKSQVITLMDEIGNRNNLILKLNAELARRGSGGEGV